MSFESRRCNVFIPVKRRMRRKRRRRKRKEGLWVTSYWS